jgi:flagellar secretion chaperone FliS
MMPQGYQQYQRTQTQTASPGELIVMMYGGAIRFLTVSQQKIEAGDTEAAHKSLVRAQEILLELMISVDTSVGPVARNLFDLYEFMHRHLVEANVKKNAAMVGEVATLMRELLQSWEQAIVSEKHRSTGPMRAVAVA